MKKKVRPAKSRRIIFWNPQAKNASGEPYEKGITLEQYRNRIKKGLVK